MKAYQVFFKTIEESGPDTTVVMYDMPMTTEEYLLDFTAKRKKQLEDFGKPMFLEATTDNVITVNQTTQDK